jgi:hypothetical protein
MPYVSRRASENKSVLGSGHAAEERKQAFDAPRKSLANVVAVPALRTEIATATESAFALTCQVHYPPPPTPHCEACGGV